MCSAIRNKALNKWGIYRESLLTAQEYFYGISIYAVNE